VFNVKVVGFVNFNATLYTGILDESIVGILGVMTLDHGEIIFTEKIKLFFLFWGNIGPV